MGARVLIVEDEQIIAADLAAQLARAGYDVIGIAIAGEEAVELADRTIPQVVLMDMRLAGPMGGPEAARLIQQRTGAGIVFVTAFPNTFLHEQQQLNPPGICVGKPFSWVQLAAALSAVLRGVPPLTG
jgi:DNA-binding response OmpR family regulator